MGTGQPNPDEGQGAYGSRDAPEGWRRGAATRAQSVGLATEAMLDMANIGLGSRVLDVAAGTGEQTLLAARGVGPTGSVLTTDIQLAHGLAPLGRIPDTVGMPGEGKGLTASLDSPSQN